MDTKARHSKPNVQKITYQDNSTQRIDNFLFKQFKKVPKSRIYKSIRTGEVRINSKRVKQEYKLQYNDIVRIPPLFQAEQTQVLKLAKNSLDIAKLTLFENDNYLIMDKPSGLMVHNGNKQEGVIEYIKTNIDNKYELVHRIDKETSGCLIIAKHSLALKKLQQEFKLNKVKKYYSLIISSQTPLKKGSEIKIKLKVEKKGNDKQVVASSEGKQSITDVLQVNKLNKIAFLQVQLITGITHQLRAQFKCLGTPILADRKYFTDQSKELTKQQKFKNLCLHSTSIEFVDPLNQENILVNAPLPDYFSVFE